MFRGLSILAACIFLLTLPQETFSGPYTEPVYEAPPYVPPPPPESKLHLIDNGDGTITDPDSGLMWAQADSYSVLGNCLNWHQSKEYAEKLSAGGYNDWRMPTLKELYGIYDDTKENVMALDHDPEQPLGLDEKFADGAAYWFWSSDYDDTTLKDCCARTFYFVKGFANLRRFSYCQYGGVRPVRDHQTATGPGK